MFSNRGIKGNCALLLFHHYSSLLRYVRGQTGDYLNMHLPVSASPSNSISSPLSVESTGHRTDPRMH